MLFTLSFPTSSIERFSRSALALSRARIRWVAIRPGKITFAVMPYPATSCDKVLDQPNNVPLRALDKPRFGIGAMTPEDVLVMILPRSEEHTSELQSRGHLVCRLL